MGKSAVPNVVAYVLPFVLYLGLVQLAAWYPAHYAAVYVAGVLLVSVVTVSLLRGRQLLRPHRHVAAGLLVGLAGIALWIPLSWIDLSTYLPDWLKPARVGFNPFKEITQPTARWGFLAVRLLGLALLVPVAEELFWRGFLLRWLISPDWESQPLGRFTPLSFTVVTVLFTLAHPEWLAAAVYCALLNGLLYWKRDLWNCVVAHAVSNLVLGVYVLATGAWELW